MTKVTRIQRGLTVTLRRIGGLLPILILCFSVVPSLQAAPFTDNFESGTLNNWVIGGRQISGSTNVANVVPCDSGSLCGHLYHDRFTEINMYRDFEFEPTGVFSFDLKVSVSSQSPPAPNYYGAAWVSFSFLNSGGTQLGAVNYLAATTNYPFTNWASSTTSVNGIPEDAMEHYDLKVSDMLGQITIDPSQIAAVRMQMNTYSSTWPYPFVSAELWIDNVTTETEPPLENVGGSVAGMSPTTGKVTCQNLTTKKKVKITIPAGVRSWDCEEAGLVVNPGDKIKQTITVTGPAD